jgi:hypothetical protein
VRCLADGEVHGAAAALGVFCSRGRPESPPYVAGCVARIQDGARQRVLAHALPAQPATSAASAGG